METDPEAESQVIEGGRLAVEQKPPESKAGGWFGLGQPRLLLCLPVISPDEPVLIRNADVYPEMNGVSVLIQDGKIAAIARENYRAENCQSYRSQRASSLSRHDRLWHHPRLERNRRRARHRRTNKMGEFMPQLKALIAVNPDSAMFGATRVNGITTAMTFPSQSGRGGAASPQFISGQAALIHLAGWTWEEMEVQRNAALQLNFPSIAGRGGRGGAEAGRGEP